MPKSSKPFSWHSNPEIFEYAWPQHPGPDRELDAMIDRQNTEASRAATEFVAADRAKKIRAVAFAACLVRRDGCWCSKQPGIWQSSICKTEVNIAIAAVDALEGLS